MCKLRDLKMAAWAYAMFFCILFVYFILVNGADGMYNNVQSSNGEKTAVLSSVHGQHAVSTHGSYLTQPNVSPYIEQNDGNVFQNPGVSTATNTQWNQMGTADAFNLLNNAFLAADELPVIRLQEGDLGFPPTTDQPSIGTDVATRPSSSAN